MEIAIKCIIQKKKKKINLYLLIFIRVSETMWCEKFYSNFNENSLEEKGKPFVRLDRLLANFNGLEITYLLIPVSKCLKGDKKNHFKI